MITRKIDAGTPFGRPHATFRLTLVPPASIFRTGRKSIRVFLPRVMQKNVARRYKSNSSNGADAPAAAFGKTACADFA